MSQLTLNSIDGNSNCKEIFLDEYRDKFKELFPDFTMIPFKITYQVEKLSKAENCGISLGEFINNEFVPFNNDMYYSYAALNKIHNIKGIE